jgi:CheY-like chemotaxis protein
MDIHMPEMDGVSATKAIRALDDADRASIPIIALTANAIKGDRENYLAAGMDDYVSKPIDQTALHESIARQCGVDAPTGITAAERSESTTTSVEMEKELGSFLDQLDDLTEATG